MLPSRQQANMSGFASRCCRMAVSFQPTNGSPANSLIIKKRGGRAHWLPSFTRSSGRTIGSGTPPRPQQVANTRCSHACRGRRRSTKTVLPAECAGSPKLNSRPGQSASSDQRQQNDYWKDNHGEHDSHHEARPTGLCRLFYPAGHAPLLQFRILAIQEK